MARSTSSSKSVRLRKRAERLLSKEDLTKIHSTDVKTLIEELRVHQIELELQNEELRRIQELLETSRSKYADLYDFAPVGYFSFNRMGRILEVNLTAAHMLRVERSLLIGKPFVAFVLPEDENLFFLHRRKILESELKQRCKLRLKRKKGSFYVSLESIGLRDHTGVVIEIRSAMIDMTEHKQLEEELREARSDLRKAQERT